MVSGSIDMVVAYSVYALAAIILFLWRPPLQATLICMFGGWLALPVAHYPPATLVGQRFTMDVIGASLPSNLSVTKALVVPVVVLACLAIRAPLLLREFRPVWLDGALAGFCLSPFLGYLADTVTARDALLQAGFLTGVWGGTWLIGRLLLGSDKGQRSLVVAIVVSGIVLAPVSLLEGMHGPWLYGKFFGPHPFQADGALRYLSYRPLGMFEHGNQFGIWMALAALAAVSLALRTQSRPGIALAGVLILCSVASQSIGALILLILGTAWLVASKRIRRIGILAGVALLALGGAAYLSGKVPIREWAKNTAAGKATEAALKATGRGSLAWRVQRDQIALPMIYSAPLTGHGRWDWWRPLGSHPWGLPLLIAGQFGLVSLALLAIAMFTGALRRLRHGSRSVLPVLVLFAGVDAWLNSYAYLPAILIAAALAAAGRRHTDANESVEKAWKPETTAALNG